MLTLLCWLPLPQSAAAQSVELSQAERDWLAANPRILLGSDAGWRPFVWREGDGSAVGIEADLIARINALTGANLVWVATENMLPNLHLAFPVPGSRIDLRYSIGKAHAPLLGIIDKALKAIEPVEMMAILRKWGNAEQPNIALSADERAWIAAHPTIRVGAYSLPPNMQARDGRVDGYLVELIQALAARAGLRAEFQVDLNVAERAYLEATVFRRALASAWTPFDFASADGAPAGVAEDYWRLIRDKLGLTRLSLETDPTPRLRDYLSKIDLAARTLLGLIDDVLDLSRIEAEKLRPRREPLAAPRVRRAGHSAVGARCCRAARAARLRCAQGLALAGPGTRRRPVRPRGGCADRACAAAAPDRGASRLD